MSHNTNDNDFNAIIKFCFVCVFVWNQLSETIDIFYVVKIKQNGKKKRKLRYYLTIIIKWLYFTPTNIRFERKCWLLWNFLFVSFAFLFFSSFLDFCDNFQKETKKKNFVIANEFYLIRFCFFSNEMQLQLLMFQLTENNKRNNTTVFFLLLFLFL